jgi:hypothetical protein
MIKESTQKALERYLAVNGGDTFMTQQACSEARQKIKWEAFREMFQGKSIYFLLKRRRKTDDT